MADTVSNQLPVEPLPGDLNTNTTVDDAGPGERPVWKQIRAEAESCRAFKRRLIPEWAESIDYRRGKPLQSSRDEDRVIVNLDWHLTKSKEASLFSQVPQVRISHPPQSVDAGEWLTRFEERLNDTLRESGIETVMEECLPDCINAAGIGAVLVAYESITEEVQLPAIDLTTYAPAARARIEQTGLMLDGSPIPMKTVTRVVAKRYTLTRISPADLLWPVNFTGSDFDLSPWLGHTGRTTWPIALQKFKLNPEDKRKVIGEDKQPLERLTYDIDKESKPEELVSYDEIIYRRYTYEENEKSFDGLHHLVFVKGIEKPVIDRPWEGQRVIPGPGGQQEIIGVQKSPIRVLTLTYISDETIPPSNSAVGRPQVDEINKSRSQMILQRDRSIPFRWADVNRVDPTILQQLMRGNWQAIIPVQGNGDAIIGEVARASMSSENFGFMDTAKQDLDLIWMTGSNQQGNFAAGKQSATEANIVQQNFSTIIAKERAKVGKFVVSIAEVLGGLMALYEPPDSFGPGFDPKISKALSYSILSDSTVLLDSQQRLDRLMKFINFAAKSGFVNVEPVLREVAQLVGLDPAVVIKAPGPKPPAEPTVSIRFTGAEDLMNPMSLAYMMAAGQAPSSELIEQAKRLIQSAQIPLQPPPGMMPPLPPPPMPPPGAGPAGPGAGAPAEPPAPAPPHAIQMIPGVAQPPVMPPVTPPAAFTAPVGAENAEWSLLPKVNKRGSNENEGNGTGNQGS